MTDYVAVGPEDVRAGLAELCSQANDMTEAMEPDVVIPAARALATLREYAGWISTAVRGLERSLGAELGKEAVGVEGVGLVAGAWQSGNWNWGDVEARRSMLQPVAEAARDRRQVTRDGEVESEAQAVVRILGETFTVYPKVTALKALGLDPQEYGTQEPGHHTVRITPLAG